MKSAILYSSLAPQTGAQIVNCYDADSKCVGAIYVRALLFDGDFPEALDKAGDFKREGETVLNTIPMVS